MAKRKKRREWELEMIGEWVSRTFPDARWQTNVRLGKIQPRNSDGRFTADEVKMLGLWRRRIDAIVFLDDRLLLVEAIMRAQPGKIAVLKLYEKLVPQTPELAEYHHLPVQKILLYAIEDPVLNVVAREEGILPIRFVPSFFDEWLRTRLPRHQRASLSTFA
jgi:hypothetical protein